MHLRDSDLEVSHAHSIVTALRDFFCPIIHSIELSNFVCVANLLKQGFDLISSFQLSEIMLGYANFRKVGWEQQVHSFWLVTIILYLKH